MWQPSAARTSAQAAAAAFGRNVRAALKIYFVWWLFVLAFTFLLGEPVLRLITGSSDARIISNAMLYLKISVPIIPPMAVLVILRNMLQGIRHTVEPLLASALELIGKVIFAVWLVPVWGYRAVCFCRANDLDHLLCVHPAGSLALPQRPAGRLPAR